MTVAELIVKLQALPQELPIYTWNEERALDYPLDDDRRAAQVEPAYTNERKRQTRPERVVIG